MSKSNKRQLPFVTAFLISSNPVDYIPPARRRRRRRVYAPWIMSSPTTQHLIWTPFRAPSILSKMALTKFHRQTSWICMRSRGLSSPTSPHHINNHNAECARISMSSARLTLGNGRGSLCIRWNNLKYMLLGACAVSTLHACVNVSKAFAFCFHFTGIPVLLF